ncbi:D-beta-hydroxybutyrate dehydrogenase [Elysia marginata]|uniref:3-oxoacyl-[acyl-carrier-protein] reductase n=1 Tax=Elysia marginata TaxID=1093978 RepID=A0AAV4HFL9_9GAST|nr:D-beta-hydroxybutyrate dehydrogenase [Elysia marginata]
MESQLTGKIALVTGSTSGIGLCLLASRGCSVVLTGLVSLEKGQEQVEEFTRKYTGKFHFLEGDFSRSEEVEKLGQDVLSIYSDGIDILVNCAGIPGRSPIEQMTTEHWQMTMAINLTAPFLLTRSFFPSMKKKGWGRIINISSTMGLVAGYGKAAYCSTKSGLLGLTRVTALEGAPHGVTCNAICPSFTDAPMCYSIIEKDAKEQGISFEERKVSC